MNLKIEKVAEAIYHCPGNSFFPSFDIIMLPWDRADENVKEHFRIMAKAAVDAYEADFGGPP